MNAMGPNLNAIYNLIETWSTGVLTHEETFERLERLMSPQNFVPVSDLVPIGNVALEDQSDQTLRTVRRIEIRLAALADQLDIPIPDEVNPSVLFDDARRLLDAGNKIQAIYVHRRRTGCGLAEAKRTCDEYLRQRDSAPSPDSESSR
jgi:hypothetical protein